MARPADLEALYELLVKEADDLGYFPVNPQKSRDFLATHLRTCLAYVAEIDGEIVGSLGIGLQDVWFSDAVLLGGYWYFLDPNFRSTNAAKALVERAKEFSDETGVPLWIPVLTDKDVNRKDAFMQRIAGMKYAGGIFVHGLGPKEGEPS